MGKGSAPRPFDVSEKQFASNWDAIFKKGVKDVLQHETENSTATSGKAATTEAGDDNSGDCQGSTVNNSDKTSK